MATYSQTRRKLRKIFNNINSNKSELNNRKNEQLILNFFKTNIKPYIIITDTDWLAKAPDGNDLKTINKGDLLPESLSVIYTDELEIPEIFLPYIDVQILIKPPPDSVLTSYNKYITKNYIGNQITVKGDNQNIYTGPYPLPGNNLLTEQALSPISVTVTLSDTPGSTKAQFKTIKPHGLTTGETIIHTAFTEAIYNGSFSVSVVTSNTYEIGVDYWTDDLGLFKTLSSGTVPPNNTKKVWNVTVFHTNPTTGDNYSTFGELVGIKTEENPESCQKETDPGPPPVFTETNIVDIFECFPNLSANPAYHKITSFTSSGFTGIGDFTDQTFTTGTPDCDIGSTVTTQTTLTKTFGTVDEYFLSLDGGQTNITQSTSTSGLHTVTGSHITSYEVINFLGYRPYYSSLTQREFQVASAGDLLLQNLPDTNVGDTLPYTAITLNRNIGNLSSLLNTSITEDIFLISTQANLVNGNSIRKDIAFFKIPGVNNFYYMKVGFGATILAPAIVDDPNPGIQTQQDTYSISGTTYLRSNNIDGVVSEAYITEKQDVQYRLIITIKNPLWFQEVRKYNASK